VSGSGNWRRELGRELTRRSTATVREILSEPAVVGGAARRCGFTGPPGAGKSCLIASLAQRRIDRGRRVGVLAVDPTSPLTRGSLLGDRIRMDAVVTDERLYIRSVPSGPCHDGLCRNVVGLLDALDGAGFDDVVLETVGVGQTSYEARLLVDTLVLVLVPDSGDTIQAMKAGILEVADIYVINKADRPAARSLAAELASILRHRAGADRWRPPVVLTSTRASTGIDLLEQAVDAHFNHVRATCAPAEAATRRATYQLRSLLMQRLEELIESGKLEVGAGGIARAYQVVLRNLRAAEV
jgi:LAO/AO transport system kinase